MLNVAPRVEKEAVEVSAMSLFGQYDIGQAAKRFAKSL
jgi:hypothetical protein